MRTQHNKQCLSLWKEKKHIYFLGYFLWLHSDSVPSSSVTQEIMASNSVQKGLLFVCCQKTITKSLDDILQKRFNSIPSSFLLLTALITRSEFLCQLDFYIELACDFLLSLSNSKYFWPDAVNTEFKSWYGQFCFSFLCKISPFWKWPVKSVWKGEERKDVK